MQQPRGDSGLQVFPNSEPEILPESLEILVIREGSEPIRNPQSTPQEAPESGQRPGNRPGTDGGPAFPTPVWESGDRFEDPGMSLRDWFAGQALIQRDSSWFADTEDGRRHLKSMAEQCYRIADAMLAAREAARG